MARGHDLFFLFVGLLAFGCSSAARRFDRDYVANGIRERTGHAVGPQADAKRGEPPPAVDPPLPPALDLSKGLTESDAVEIALWRNQDLAAELEDLGVSRSALLQAGLLRNPAFDLLIPIGRKELEMTASFPIELSGQIFFRKKAAALDLEATAGRLIHAGVELAAKVKAAYAEAESAIARDRRQDEIVKLFEDAVRVSEARNAAGDVSDQELRLARLELLQARQERMRLEEEMAVARERLNLLMGLEAARSDWRMPPPPEPAEPAASPADEPAIRADPDAAVAFALEHRLDARAARIEVEAAGERIGLARASAVPVVGGLLDVKDRLVGPGVSSEIPVFDFNQAGMARSNAEFRAAGKRWLAVRDRVAAEVRSTLETLAGERRQQAFFRGEILPRAEEAAGAARRSFELGEEPFLVVVEIERKLAEARRDEALAFLRVRLAEIELERSLGGRMPGSAPPSPPGPTSRG